MSKIVLATLATLALLATLLPAFSQRHFATGDSYTFEFNTLPLSTPNILSGPARGVFALGYTNPSIFQQGNSILLEMFENTTNSIPLCSQVLTPGPGQQCGPLGAWQDLQGVIRLTMTSGSATIDEFIVQVHREDGFPLRSLYTETVHLVPEPSTLAFYGMASFLALVFLKHKR